MGLKGLRALGGWVANVGWHQHLLQFVPGLGPRKAQALLQVRMGRDGVRALGLCTRGARRSPPPAPVHVAAAAWQPSLR